MSHQSDLPPHVPSCVSTGAGVTVPDATATPRTQAFLCSSRNEDDISAFMENLERELTSAKAQLRERTQWQCKCGGTDCAGQAENERLRAEVEAMRSVYLKGCDCAPDEACAFAVERDQLRARAADLENDLEKSKHDADDWHRAWETVTEQAKKEVAELGQENTRLTQLLRNRLVEVQEQQQGGITT